MAMAVWLMTLFSVLLAGALVCWHRQSIRTIICWGFLYSCVRYVIDPRVSIFYAIHKSSPILPTLRNVFAIALYGVFPIVCGLAWWTIWKRKSSARPWGVAASLMNISVFIPPMIVVRPQQRKQKAGGRRFSDLLLE